MHEATLAVEKLTQELEDLKRTIELYDERKKREIAEVLEAFKKEEQKRLIESDIQREVAKARLDAYEKMVPKDDVSKEIREMLKNAIQALGGRASGSQQQQKSGGQPAPADK